MKVLSKFIFSILLLQPLTAAGIELLQQQSNWYRDADAMMREVMSKVPNVNKTKKM